MSTREFDLGDVLTVADGRLLSPRGMEAVYDILNFMTGDNLFTHQLPRALRACKPAIIAQHPQLADVDRTVEIKDDASLAAWLAGQQRIYGERLTVAPLAQGDWVEVDPVLELGTMVDKDRIIAVNDDLTKLIEDAKDAARWRFAEKYGVDMTHSDVVYVYRGPAGGMCFESIDDAMRRAEEPS